MPPKRQRGGAGAGAITMRHHPIAEGDVGPLIVGFQQGPPLEGALLGGGAGAGSDNPLVFEYMRSSNPRRTQRKLYARSDLAKYEASTKGASAVDYKCARRCSRGGASSASHSAALLPLADTPWASIRRSAVSSTCTRQKREDRYSLSSSST